MITIGLDVRDMGALNCVQYLSTIRNSDICGWFLDEVLHWVMIEAAVNRGENISINHSIKLNKMYLNDVKVKGSPKIYPFIDQNDKRRRKR